MATLKIENKSQDDIVICFDGETADIVNDESLSFENVNKGAHHLSVHRKRVPQEKQSGSSGTLEAFKNADSLPASHIQLDYSAEFDIISSKATAVISNYSRLEDTLHEDALFSGYKSEISGSKITNETEFFASEKIEKAYLKKQISGAFFPVGIVGIIVLLIGAFLTVMGILDITFSIGGAKISMLNSVLLFAAGLIVTVYFIINTVKIKNKAKSLHHKK